MRLSFLVLPLGLAGALLSVMPGCTTPTSTKSIRTVPPAQLQVEAIRNDDTAAQGRYGYKIVDGMPPGTDERTYFDLAAGYVRTALSSKGLFEVPSDIRPDMIVEIDFGMEAPMIAIGDSYNIGWTGDDPSALRVDEIVYDKYLRITARETAEQANGRPPRELWSIYVSNRDFETNLPRYILLMVSAAMDQLGERTASRRMIVLTLKDERVVFVQKGL